MHAFSLRHLYLQTSVEENEQISHGNGTCYFLVTALCRFDLRGRFIAVFICYSDPPLQTTAILWFPVEPRGGEVDFYVLQGTSKRFVLTIHLCRAHMSCFWYRVLGRPFCSSGLWQSTRCRVTVQLLVITTLTSSKRRIAEFSCSRNNQRIQFNNILHYMRCICYQAFLFM